MKLPRTVVIIVAVATALPIGAQEQPPAPAASAPPETLVLPTERVIDFETDEVTWMSVDVSPDGRTVVFELLGDLFTLPIAGGTATRIVGGMSFESQPTWSPDGKTIAFLSDRSGVETLWIADPDGGNPGPSAGPPYRRPLAVDGVTGVDTRRAVPRGVEDSAARPTHVLALPLSSRRRQRRARRRAAAATAIARCHGPASATPAEPARRGGVARWPVHLLCAALRRLHLQRSLPAVADLPPRPRDRRRLAGDQRAGQRDAAVLSPDGKWLVYGTRHKADTGLRIRNLETGAERWLAWPVTRDDQESRASRDTLPRYDFLPEANRSSSRWPGSCSASTSPPGRRRRFRSPPACRPRSRLAPTRRCGSTTAHGAGAAGALAAAVAGWHRLVFSALNHLYVMDASGGTPRRLTTAEEGEFMPAWAPDGQSIAYVTWTTTGGHIKRVPAAGGAVRTLTAHEGYYLDPAFTPDGSRVAFLAGAASDQLYAILLDTPPPSEQPEDVAEIGGITPPNAIEIRWMPADGGAQTLVASAQGGRGLQFVGTDSSRIYFTTNRGLQSITLDGLDRRTVLRVQGVGPGNNPPSADDIVLAPDGRGRSSTCRTSTTSSTVPRAGRETVEVRIQGRVENTPVPVKRMSLEGGEYPAWTARRATVTWSWGAQFFRQAVDAAEPQKTDVVVEMPRSRPSGSILLSGARVITMIGDQVIESGDVLVTDNRIVAVGERGRVAAPAGIRRLDLRGKTVMPGLVDVHAHMWAPRGLHQTAIWQYYANLAYGVTTTRDPQTSTPDVFAYADMVDAGMMPGPRVFATGPGVFSSSGIEDREAAFRFLKRYKEAYRTNTIKQYVAGDRLVRQWIIEASHEYGITPTIEGSLDLKLNLTQIADGYTGQEHGFPIMPLHKDVVEFVARTKTFYTPTILVAYGAPWSENHWFETENTVGDAKLNRWIPNELLDTMIRRRPQWFVPEEYGHTKLGKQVADIVHAGGRAGLGSHGQLQGLGAHWETWNLGSGGLTPHETLKVVTIFGAEALGLQQDVGSIDPASSPT